MLGLEMESDRKGNLWACTARIQCGPGAHQLPVLTEVFDISSRIINQFYPKMLGHKSLFNSVGSLKEVAGTLGL